MENTPSIWLCEHVVHAMEEKGGFQQCAKDSEEEKVTRDGQLGPRPQKAVAKEPHPLWSTHCVELAFLSCHCHRPISTSEVGVATFQGLNSHTLPLATALNRAVLRG